MRAWVTLLKEWPGELQTSFNVSPGQIVPVVTALGLRPMRWNLIPAWSKEKKLKYATFNARLETAATKPTYRGAWKKRQTCLVPVCGYFEWRDEPEGKRPYFISSQEGLLVLAGLWDRNGTEDSFTLLTTDSSGPLAEIHHRKPVFVGPALAEEFLRGCYDFAFQEDVEELIINPVGKEVNSSRAQGEELILSAK